MKVDPPNSPIERFTVRGLHGYKDVSVEFAGPATVVVAENGMGKTTVLNMLNAFLTCRFHRLQSFSFSSIECQFRNQLFPLVLEKGMLGSSEETEEDDPLLAQLLEHSSAPLADLLDFLRSYTPGQFSRFQQHPLIRQIYQSSPYSYPQIEKLVEDAFASTNKWLSSQARALIPQVRRSVGEDVEVVFLPTYRRIEKPQLRPRRPDGRPSSTARGMRGGRASWNYSDIVFGLSDVEEKLAEISDEIERRSNFGYRNLSARILDEMLKGTAVRESVTMSDLPDVASLSRFLSRVGRTERLNEVFSDIENLYKSHAIENADNWFLRYFLSRLGRVIEQTREMEQKVEQFVSVCNSYLTQSQGDRKRLSFDPQTLRVVVEDLWAQRQIPLEALSSGEKQIVSMMARLHLSETKKIVLIDEPELSLSLDWQRKLLPDVLNSGSVVQMLAITHSPFVFENELDSAARPLIIKLSEAVNG